jgi:hypothetical protein
MGIEAPSHDGNFPSFDEIYDGNFPSLDEIYDGNFPSLDEIYDGVASKRILI